MMKNYMTYRSAVMLSVGMSLVLYLFFIIGVYLRDAMIGPDANMHTIKYVGLRTLIGFLSNFILLFVLYLFNFRILRSEMPQKRKITVVIIGSILLAIMISFLWSRLLMAFSAMPEHPDGINRPVWGGIFRDVFLSGVVVFTSQLLYLSQRRQQIALEYEALRAENMKTKYEALKNQVDPHSLFNTLSTLDSLVGIDPVKAREYIQKFSSVFRYTLQNKDIVPLEEELAFSRDYASLMQIRYGDSLKINFNADSRYYSHMMVPLGVQTLVENAIKHNVISRKRPLVINIDTTGEDMLRVCNNYQPKDIPEPGAGVGLANLAERYLLKWQKDISVEQAGDTFCVYLPLVKQ